MFDTYVDKNGKNGDFTKILNGLTILLKIY